MTAIKLGGKSLDEKLRKLITNSVFLDEIRKKKLLNLWNGLDIEKKQKLSAVLQKEKPLLSNIISVFVKQATPDQIEAVENILLGGKKLLVKKREKVSKHQEEQELKNVLLEIDNSN